MTDSAWLRGHVLSPLDSDALRWEPSGAIGWRDGLITSSIDGAQIALDDEVLLVPGFIDSHVHLPQFRVRGRFQDALLPWLRESIWPEEARFSDRDYRVAVASEFRDGLIAAGTTGALVYGSPHDESAHAVLNDLAPLCIRGGDVLMDRNSPADLLRDTAEALNSAARHVTEYGDRYALTPRFAPTCTPELMAGLGQLAAGSRAWVQTHLAENVDEVAWVRELHPEARSYLDVYDRAGLLGPRTVLGHCIHLDATDLSRMAETGTWVAHCPTSNVALGSGRMEIERMRAAGVSVALGTDVGAGPELSMLHVMAVFLAVQEAQGARPVEALTLATRAGAQAMGEGSRRGSLAEGRVADVVALRVPGGLRRADSPDSVLLRVLAEFEDRWDEAVAAVIIGGHRVA